jgi:hypothetical protein
LRCKGKAALNAYSAALTPQEDSDSQMVIQAVQDADVPSEEKVKALEALKEATMQVYDAVLGEMETIKAAKMKWFQTHGEVLERLEAVAAQAASTPEPSDAELAQQALDFVQRVTEPRDEQEGDDPHIPSHPNEETASASTAAGRGL